MFFLSASANILFYSLIPVFFFLCFSFQPKLEITEITPIGITAENYRIATEVKQAFYYNIFIKSEQEDSLTNFSIFQRVILSFPFIILWKDYSPTDGFSLRAPPLSF